MEKQGDEANVIMKIFRAKNYRPYGLPIHNVIDETDGEGNHTTIVIFRISDVEEARMTFREFLKINNIHINMRDE